MLQLDCYFERMRNMLENKHWETVFSVIQRSYAIDNHLDFFTWLQNGVNTFLPHNMLLACWGEFENNLTKNKLSYDVASSLSDINTQIIFDASDDVDACMLNLHTLWLNNNRCWFVINNLDNLAPDSNFKACFPGGLKQLKSLMVYGVCDVRGGNECLYVFFSKEETFEVPVSIMGLIMPHIDNVLRKIQHMAPIDTSSEPASTLSNGGLTARELEVIHWIKSGKTNQEIGIILLISENTVKSHVKRIFQKLNVTRRAQAVALLSGQ